MSIMDLITANIDYVECTEDIEERIDAFETSIYSTDFELLALLSISRLENRLRILRRAHAPLRFRVAVKEALEVAAKRES